VDAVRQLESALRAIRFRLMVRRAVGWSVRAGWIAAATAAVLLLVGLLVLGAPIGAAILLPAPPLAALATAAVALARRPSLADCAAWADRAGGLEERVTTAYETAVLGSRVFELSPGVSNSATARRAPRVEVPMGSALLADALESLRRADLGRASRLATPRETPLLVAALAALAILFVVPGEPPAGARPAGGSIALREAARALAAPLTRHPAPNGFETLQKAVRETLDALRDGSIPPAEAQSRLRELARLIESARAEATGREGGAGDAAPWLEDLLGAARAAAMLAGEAAGAGGASSPSAGGGTVEDRARALEGAFASGFAARVPVKGGDALRDFASASAPRAPRGGDGAGASAAGRAADIEALLAAPRRALAERRWPRWKYDPVVDRYFGIDARRRD
jgi:hypothetical protein